MARFGSRMRIIHFRYYRRNLAYFCAPEGYSRTHPAGRLAELPKRGAVVLEIPGVSSRRHRLIDITSTERKEKPPLSSRTWAATLKQTNPTLAVKVNLTPRAACLCMPVDPTGGACPAGTGTAGISVGGAVPRSRVCTCGAYT